MSPIPSSGTNAEEDTQEVARLWDTQAIAIIGIGCRFPLANGPKEFWKLLCHGQDAITEIPRDRFSIDEFYDSRPATAGKLISRFGGFIRRESDFDNLFFGISPREAECMDPQQRLLLEVAWEALEDAGVPPERLAGTPTGVFVGAFNDDYQDLQLYCRDQRTIDLYVATGSTRSVLAGRISCFLDLRGPSFTVDTACSSSLVAVHLACQSLNAGECTTALAAGVNLVLLPERSLAFSQASMLSADGRCKFGDIRADGFVRSDGVGVIVLKPLSQALQDGDSVYAVIRGSAVDNDGQSSGFLTTPSVSGQELVLRQAYHRANIAPCDVQYVEAHGTGTAVGDPVEIEALARVLGDGRLNGQPCYVGSVKSNIGHTESTAGIAGLIKTALALHYRLIPSTLHVTTESDRIPWREIPITLCREATAWPRYGGSAKAGVSSFGISGTNAHAVLEEAPDASRSDGADQNENPNLLVLSAPTQKGLVEYAGKFRDLLLEDEARNSIADVCFSCSQRRTHYEHRLALAAVSLQEAAAQLDEFTRGNPVAGLSSGVSGQPPKVVFVFPGQGSQWEGMGRELFRANPAFRSAILACENAFSPYIDWSLLEVLEGNCAPELLARIDVIQPMLFAIDVALAAVWNLFGITADAVIGHSMGEIAAAYIAGALTLEDAAQVICLRSKLLRTKSGAGAMMVVDLSLQEARNAVAEFAGSVSIAVSNSRSSTVLSGDESALQQIVGRLQQQDVYCRPVKADVASHSPYMDELTPRLLQVLQNLTPRVPAMPFYSTVDGELGRTPSFDARYWARNLRNPVMFSAVVENLLREGHTAFIEVSPHPILLSSVRDAFDSISIQGLALQSLRRNEPERKILLESLGTLYCNGYPINWTGLHPSRRRFVRYPTMPWQHEKFWRNDAPRDSRASGASRPSGRTAHPLLGKRIDNALHPNEHMWQLDLSLANASYLADHRVKGYALVPGASYLDLALTAAKEVYGSGAHALRDVSINSALLVPADQAVEVQLALVTEGPGLAQFKFFSRADSATPDTWTVHAQGKICFEEEPRQCLPVVLEDVQRRCSLTLSGAQHYEQMRSWGLNYGASFRGVQQVWRNGAEALARVEVPCEIRGEQTSYEAHPAFLDSALQVIYAEILRSASAQTDVSAARFLPVGFREVHLTREPGNAAWCHARLQPCGSDDEALLREGNLDIFDENGVFVGAIRGMQVAQGTELATPVTTANLFYTVKWHELKSPEALQHTPAPDDAGRSWLIFSDSTGTGRKLKKLFERIGHRCVLVEAGDGYCFNLTDHSCELDPRDPAQFSRLFTDISAWDGEVDAIVHLWSLDAGSVRQDSELAFDQSVGVCQSIYHLISAISQAGLSKVPRLNLITRGVYAFSGDAELAIWQAPLWGLGRSIAYEQPELHVRLMDLEPGSSAQEIEHLASHLCFEEEEDQLALRGDRRYAIRLTPVEFTTDTHEGVRQSSQLDAKKTYLITGGSGGLGLSVAQHMVEHGAKYLVLASRRGTVSEAEGQISQMKSAGATVMQAKADCAIYNDVERLVAEIHGSMPPLGGVIHAAAVLDDGIALQMNGERLRSVMSPKIKGAVNLWTATAHETLDFFVCFSSAASLLGSPGQSNYCAANAFLDSFAQDLSRKGVRASSINWGPWLEVGLAIRPDRGARLSLKGLASLHPQVALEALESVLQDSPAQVGILALDAEQWMRSYPMTQTGSLFAHFRQAPAKTNGAQIQSSHGDLPIRETVLNATAEKRDSLLHDYLMQQVGRILRMPASRLTSKRPLIKMGFDSLMGVELKNRITSDLNVVLPLAKILKGANITELAGVLCQAFNAAANSERMKDAGTHISGAVA